MSLARKTFKNSVWSLIGFLWPLGLFFFSIPYFIRKLGVEQYGIWVLVGSAIGILEILNLGGDALIKFVSEYCAKDDFDAARRIVANSFFIYLVISVVVIFPALILSPYFISFFNIERIYEDTVLVVLKIAIFGFVINLFMTNALSVFKGLQRYDLSTMVTVATDTIRILGMMILIYMGFGLRGMVIANVGGTAAGLFLTLILLNKLVPQISLRPSFDRGTMEKIFSYSFFSFLVGLSGMLRTNIGNILVGKFLGFSHVPYFSVPFQVSNKLLAGMASLATVLFPVFSSLKGKDETERIKKMFVDANKLIATLGFAIGGTMFVFSNGFLSLWITPKFATIANLPFRILIISFMFTLTATNSYFLLMGYGKMKVIAAMQNLTTFAVLILGILILPKYGIIGISLVYAIANAALIIYVYFAAKMVWVRNKLNQIVKAFLPATISLFCGSIIFGRLLSMETTTLLQLVSYGILCTITFLIFTVVLDYKFFRKYLIALVKR